MEEHNRMRILPQALSKTFMPQGHRKVAPSMSQQQQQRIHMAQQQYETNYVQLDHSARLHPQQQKIIQHQNKGDHQSQDQYYQHFRSHSAGEQRTASLQAQAAAQAMQQHHHLVSTATTTDDLPTDGIQTMPKARSLQSNRPKSLANFDSFDKSNTGEHKCRDRTHRSLEGRRRSLERMQCVDLTDASPPTPARNTLGSGKDGDKPSQAQLEEYERELRRRLLHGGDSTTNDALETFETLLKESMDDVATLMREVQQELTLIRAEERRFQSQSTQSLHRLSSAGINSMTNTPRHHRSPVWDTLSIDGQLPFLPSFATASLASASSAYHNTYPSMDKLNGIGFLTGSEMSDDDRSLTTAISDDEDLNVSKSAFKHRSNSAAINFECLGSVRKSGFLSVKKWLVRRRHTLELARKRGWKGYWVCLKGTTLLFYSCDSVGANSVASSNNNIHSAANNNNHEQLETEVMSRAHSSTGGELTPKHLIFVEGCLVQPIPEHPHKDNVFCLSTSFGDAYLFDATSLPERDQWINLIHSSCAAQLSRNSGKCAISHYLIEECQKLDRLVDLDVTSRKEADLLLSCATEEKQKQQLVTHVMMLEDKIEKNRVDIFRLKTYFSA